jgi:predicted dehydrogenase
MLGQRHAAAMSAISMVDDVDRQFPSDGRIAPVSRLAARFLDEIKRGTPGKNGFREGLRVQALLDTARRANELGHWLDVEPENLESRS